MSLLRASIARIPVLRLSRAARNRLRVAIIGSGFGGIGMAIKLAAAGVDFTILEKSESVGGVWRDNTYPGAACDVPSHLYSFSFETKTDWSRVYGLQEEIRDYLEHCVDKYGLRDRIRFGTEIAGATFDASRGVWTIESVAGDEFEAEVLVPAMGQLSLPRYPDIPGLDDFEGVAFHSARWRHDVDLTGKSVVSIGTGASAIQYVPEIARAAEHVTVVQRSAPWVLPKPDRSFTDAEKAVFRLFPPLRSAYRGFLYAFQESQLSLLANGRLARGAERLVKDQITKHIDDPDLRRRVTPDYPIGCKRVLISNDWYRALARPNVDLVTDAIEAVEADGVRTAAGRRIDADVLIYGTGFRSTEFLAPVSIRGLDAVELGTAWSGGAEAYLGMTVAGFPNMFMLYGPNTNLGHNSILFMIECQIRYIMQAIEQIAAPDVDYIDVRPDVQRAFNTELQQRLDASIWAGDCSSWYKTESGKNTNNWAGPTLAYMLETARFDAGDFEYRGVASDTGRDRAAVAAAVS